MNTWSYEDEQDPLTLPVILLFGIARNHPFAQGNKPTALAAALAFLEGNGLLLLAPDEPDELADRIVAVIEGDTPEIAFVTQLRPSLIALPEEG